MSVELLLRREMGRGFALRSLGAGVAKVGQLLALYWHRHNQRRQLLALEYRLLDDIGLSRADALREGRKHFWQA